MSCSFPDLCIYTYDWLQFGSAGPARVSLKGSGSVCVGFLLVTSSHAQPIQIVITNSFLFIHPKLGELLGGGD